MPEGSEIKRAADRIKKVLVGKDIIENNFFYERLYDKRDLVKNENIKEITTLGRLCLFDLLMIGQCIVIINYMEGGL